jgi:MFS family permease
MERVKKTAKKSSQIGFSICNSLDISLVLFSSLWSVLRLHLSYGTQCMSFFLFQIVFLGMMLSSTFWGNLSDRYGRKQVGRIAKQLYIIKLIVTHTSYTEELGDIMKCKSDITLTYISN